MDAIYFKNYTEECLETLIERAMAAKEKAGMPDSVEFDKGRSFGYFEVMNYLFNQAEIFGIKDELKEKIRHYTPSW